MWKRSGITRRQLLLGSAALGAGPFLAQNVPALGVAGVQPAVAASRTFHRVLVDGRYPAAREFGRAFATEAPGLATFDGDLSAVWLEEIYPQWRVRPLAIAGLTHHRALICLASFARGHGLRVIFEGTHQACADGAMKHRLRGPDAAVRIAATALGKTRPWPEQLATLIAGFPTGAAAAATTELSGIARPTDAGTLFSWVIAAA